MARIKRKIGKLRIGSQVSDITSAHISEYGTQVAYTYNGGTQQNVKVVFSADTSDPQELDGDMVAYDWFAYAAPDHFNLLPARFDQIQHIGQNGHSVIYNVERVDLYDLSNSDVLYRLTVRAS